MTTILGIAGGRLLAYGEPYGRDDDGSPSVSEVVNEAQLATILSAGASCAASIDADSTYTLDPTARRLVAIIRQGR